MEDGVIPGALHDKRAPVKAWIVTYDDGTMAYFIGERPETSARVDPITIHYGHETDKIRDAW